MRTKIKQRDSAFMMILFTATPLSCPLDHGHQIDEETENRHVTTPDSFLR